MEEKRKVKVGVLGIKRWARVIIESVAGSPELELVTGFSRTQEHREEFAKKYNCKLVNSMEEMLALPEVEGVLISTPNHVHCEQIVACAEAGKHVFVIKPITNTIAEAKKAIEACKKAGVLLQVGQPVRFAASSRYLKKLIDEGKMGKVVLAESHNSHSGGMRLTPELWRWYQDKCPSGPLMQLGVHNIDTLHYLLGPIERVSAFLTKLATPAEIEDTTTVIFEFESGALGYNGTNYVCPRAGFLWLHGTGATACVTRDDGLQVEVKDGKWEPVELERVDTALAESNHFGRCIREGRSPEVTGEVGMHNLAVVRAAILSSREGRSVTIEEVLQRDDT
jgi:predicted dehydrogenase